MMRSVLLLSLLIAVAFAGKSKAATTTAADAEAFIRGAASSFLGAEIPAAAKCSTSFSEADLTTLTTALNDFKTFDPMAWSNAFSKISPIMNDVKACASNAGTDATEAKAFEAKLMKSFGANSFLTDAWDVLTKDHSTLWSEAFGPGGMIPSFEAKNFGAAGTKFGDIVVTIVNTNTALVQTTDDHWSEVEPLSEAESGSCSMGGGVVDPSCMHFISCGTCYQSSNKEDLGITMLERIGSCLTSHLHEGGTCAAVGFTEHSKSDEFPARGGMVPLPASAWKKPELTASAASRDANGPTSTSAQVQQYVKGT